MPRNLKRVAVAVALAGALAAAGTIAFTAVRPSAGGAAGPSPASAAAPGARGGVVLKTGAYALEIVPSEQDGAVTLSIYPSVDGKPLKPGPDAVLDATLVRYDGTRAPLTLVANGERYTTREPLAKPHVFDVQFQLRAGALRQAFSYTLGDGLLPLTAEQIRASKIGLAQAAPAEIVASFQLPGEIKFNEDRTAHVVPRIAGVVEQVNVAIGQQVRKGDVLAVIASTDLSDRRSELLTAQKRLTGARQVYAREKTLWEERISAEQDYQAAQVQLREAEIAVQNAQQKLSAINASATGALNRYALRAPFSGTIVEKHVTPGEAVAADANVFVLADLSTVWAEMAVPAQRLDEVRVGRRATVSATAFDSQASGEIAYVGALLGAQTRTAPARVVLPNPSLAWRPGLFVNVSVDARARAVPVAIETRALQTLDGRPAVFVETARGFVAQPVELGERDGRFTEVTRGLRAGQRYATDNSFILKSELEKGSAEGH
ncbi:efflux RND transporter periplasmic adaptor subunit [Burkholderia sp. FERM BP-3421]|uniref:efflux RND transporter periplasmic adaptor subunit n=1 Tax=Burkholderia sp. FERM BP-3421 TaxID=1494466 RepID=UPI0023608580|nr:efflux RND transporter periplasmic adaptor subunit [Burkholderia sp. FERM BP-3421]WDD91645.1 efflux RND transporter periplasmic adaptor subunit [Burkholderia sp. FERM BP-3421]